MNKLRKALILSLSVITVFSMSMIAVPQQADAASAGDLIKIDGYAPVYYLGSDNKRYVFPNESTYFSWYSDFSSVVTLGQTEVESYPLAANVVIRPGTKLVKRPVPTDPKVYAVEPNGVLRHIPDETTAVALYGDNWAQRVVDVPDSFFVNYTISTGDVVATAYPAGSLVKFDGSADVYYINAAGEAQKIADEAAFNANRFKWDDVLNAPSTMAMPTAGDDITGASDVANTDQGGNSGTGPVVNPNVGTGLSVVLSSETPASHSIPSGATLVPFATVNFTASNDGDVTLTDLVFKRVGTGPTTDISGGYLYLGDTRLTNKKTINSSDHTMTFNGVGLTISAGMTKAITLKINANTGDRTGNHAFELVSASSVTTDGASVSGAFPIVGNTMAFSAVDAAGVTFTGDTSTYNYDIGETNVVVAEFDIANDAQEDVNIYRIRLKNGGTANDSAISNISLDLDGTIIMENVSMADDYVDFLLENPFLLKKSKTITATVRGDIIADPTKDVKLYLRNDADVDVRGTAYGDFYSANITRTAFDATTETDDVNIQGSDINISFDGPAASDVRDDRDDVVFANFKIAVAGDGVQIDTFPIHLYMTGAGSSADNLENFEIVDTTNNVTYTVADSTASSTDTTYNFEDVVFQEGKDYTFEVRGDIPDGATTGRIYHVGFTASDVTGANYITSDEAVASSAWSATSLTGKNMTVASPSVTFSKVSTNDTTYVKDANKVLLYKGKITASGVDDLSVRKVKFTGTFGGGATNNAFDDAFDKLYFNYVDSNGDEVELDTETSLTDATAVSFSAFTMSLPKGTSNGVYVTVRGDVSTNATAGTYGLGWATASVSDYSVKDSDNNTFIVGQYSVSTTAGHTTTIATQGTYSMVVDTEETGLNTDKNVLAGGVRLLGRLKVTADKENATIEDLVLQATTTSGTAITNDDVATLYLYSDKEMTTLLGSSDLAAGSNPKALFEDVNISIPTTGVTYLYIGGLVKGIDYSSSPAADSTAHAGRQIKLTVPGDAAATYITKVVGADTGETLSNTYSPTVTNVSTVMGAVITAVTTDFANATLSNGIGKDIFSFKVTVPASANTDYDGTALGVQLATSTFTIATSSGVTLGSYKIERVGGANGEVAASASLSGTSLTVGIRDSYGSNVDRIVRPGETAEYVIRATIGGVGSNDSLQATLEGMSTNMPYLHNVGSNGSLTGVTSTVYPLISGLSNVRGGTLTN